MTTSSTTHCDRCGEGESDPVTLVSLEHVLRAEPPRHKLDLCQVCAGELLVWVRAGRETPAPGLHSPGCPCAWCARPQGCTCRIVGNLQMSTGCALHGEGPPDEDP